MKCEILKKVWWVPGFTKPSHSSSSQVGISSANIFSESEKDHLDKTHNLDINLDKGQINETTNYQFSIYVSNPSDLSHQNYCA